MKLATAAAGGLLVLLAGCGSASSAPPTSAPVITQATASPSPSPSINPTAARLARQEARRDARQEAQRRAAAAVVRCTASMSSTNPGGYGTTDVLVRTSPGAAVSATAHYRTDDTTNKGFADSSGAASIPFYLSGAILGYRVAVDVTATLNGHSASCSTSFTPVPPTSA